MAKAKSQLETELRRLTRRLQLLRDVQTGEARLRRVTVVRKKMSWTVRAQTRTYVRYIAPAGWKPKKR